MKYTSELTEREIDLARMHKNKLFWHLKKEEEMTNQEAHEEIDRIKRKVESIEAFEVRQIIRGQKINQAKVEAQVKGTNELLIMSEV
jgi:hypothetical protein